MQFKLAKKNFGIEKHRFPIKLELTMKSLVLIAMLFVCSMAAPNFGIRSKVNISQNGTKNLPVPLELHSIPKKIDQTLLAAQIMAGYAQRL